MSALDKSPWRFVGSKASIPTFRSEKDCKLHAGELRYVATNPRGKPFCHYVSMMCGWDDLETCVWPSVDLWRRRIQDSREVVKDSPLKSLFETPLYRHLGPPYAHTATANTWAYLFKEIRCGIFVKITGGKVVLFVPFYNPHYRNHWPKPLPFSLDGKTIVDYATYLKVKNTLLKWPEGVEEDHGKWWANGSVVCNVSPANGWGDAYLAHLRDMLEATCASHEIGDVEFFINKRDNPVLRRDRRHPCALDKRAGVLRGVAVAPVLGFYSSSRYADLVIPTGEDWELATGAVFPPRALSSRTKPAIREATSKAWTHRKPQAVFRGSATGAGVTCETNLRLALVCRSQGMADVDAGIVKWALRDKVYNGFIRFIHPPSLPFAPAPYMAFADQCAYKVQIYVDGHAAANRLGTMLLSGSLIVRLMSKTIKLPDGHDSWLTAFLKPYDWRTGGPLGRANCLEVPLDDLGDALAWVWKHDRQAEHLAANAKALGSRILSSGFICDYLAKLLNGLHAKTQGAPRSTLFPTASGAYLKPLFCS